MNRTPAHIATSPSVDHVRSFPNSYEVDAWGGTYGTQAENSWQRGEILRTLTPTGVAFPPPVPMYDPTIMSDPNQWKHDGK